MDGGMEWTRERNGSLSFHCHVSLVLCEWSESLFCDVWLVKKDKSNRIQFVKKDKNTPTIK
ncbi:hypothetical protein HanRHA438_Chr00c03g0844841 [Helianthus annuus]|nr:hypothetical protein HanRHA438_Chr00c03g0844841 [Helianthus annuus]